MRACSIELFERERVRADDVVEDGRACILIFEQHLAIVVGEVRKDVVEDVRSKGTVVGTFVMAQGFEGVA